MVLAAWNQCLFLRDLTEGGTLRWWLMCRLLFTHGELRGFYALFLWLLVSGQLMSPKRVWTYTPFHVLKVVWRPHRPHSVFVKAFKFSFRSAVRFKLNGLKCTTLCTAYKSTCPLCYQDLSKFVRALKFSFNSRVVLKCSWRVCAHNSLSPRQILQEL